jgi:hypothetical protein
MVCPKEGDGEDKGGGEDEGNGASFELWIEFKTQNSKLIELVGDHAEGSVGEAVVDLLAGATGTESDE